jgi:hypothetical protein
LFQDIPPPEELLLKDIEDWPNVSNRMQSVTSKILQSQQNIALNTGRLAHLLYQHHQSNDNTEKSMDTFNKIY